jgi:hypothetical protein
MPGRAGRQVTFATRIGPESAAGGPRGRPRLAVAGALALLGLVGAGAYALRQFAAPPPSADAHLNTNAKVPANPNANVLQFAHLTIKTDPPGAEARLGDQLLGLTPVEAEVPLHGPSALKLRRRGFAPVERALAFGGSPPAANVVEKLAPLPRGQLTLNALPWAHVTIDGEKVADTPLVKWPLTAGPHAVRVVSPPTGRELRLTVVVEADREVRRVIDLRGEPRLTE